MVNDTRLTVLADQCKHVYRLPHDHTLVTALWTLMWNQQDRAPPFQCDTLGTVLNFLRLVNTAPTESAALWSLAALPPHHGGVILGRHNTIEWEHAILQLLHGHDL